MRGPLGCKRIGGAGYCFGGKYVCRFLKEGKLDAGYTAHPSFVDAEEVEGVTGPLSIAAAGMYTFFIRAMCIQYSLSVYIYPRVVVDSINKCNRNRSHLPRPQTPRNRRHPPKTQHTLPTQPLLRRPARLRRSRRYLKAACQVRKRAGFLSGRGVVR